MQKIFFILLLIFLQSYSFSQNVGIGTSTPDSSAALEIKSSTQGFLPPRMTTAQRNAISKPVAGLQIYNTTTDCLEIFSKGRWQKMFCGVDETPINTDSNAVTDIDGHVYPTVKICNQTWMAKNLDVARYRNGDLIPQVTDPTQWANLTTGAWCWYNNDSATYGSVYGRLYNWYAVNDPRGLAPQGWHVPSDAEWNTISDCLGGANVAGGKLKESGTLHWNSPNTGAVNTSNLSIYGGGYRDMNGTYNDLGVWGDYWTCSDYQNNFAKHRGLNYSIADLISYFFSKKGGFSLRCIKDITLSTIDSGLIAYYPFNGNANDESGNGNNGVVNGATLTNDRFGNSGKAYNFDGTSNYIHSVCNNLPSQERTISVWINTNDPSHRGLIMAYGGNGTCGTSFIAGVNHRSSNQLMITGHCSANETQVNYIPVSNQWDHLVIVSSISGTKVYINGILRTSSLNYFSNTIGSNLFIGTAVDWSGTNPYSDVNGQNWLGKIDDIRIYNRALTQVEITYLATH